MPDQPPQRVTCPACGVGYRWRAEHVGGTVACKQCGNDFIVPDQPGPGLMIEPAGDDGIFELADTEDEQPSSTAGGQAAGPGRGRHAGRCPSCNSALKAHAVLCMNCGFNVAEGTRVSTQVAEEAEPQRDGLPDRTSPATAMPMSEAQRIRQREQRDAERAAEALARHRLMEYKLPTLLLVIGGVLALLNIFALAPFSPSMTAGQASYLDIALGTAASILINNTVTSALFLFTLLAMVAVLNSGFGTMGSTLLKVVGISLACTQVSLALHFGTDIATGGLGIISFIIRWPIYLAMFFIAAWKLLELDGTELKIVFVVMVFMRALALFAAYLVLGSFY